jgi:hypothetical protein
MMRIIIILLLGIIVAATALRRTMAVMIEGLGRRCVHGVCVVVLTKDKYDSILIPPVAAIFFPQRELIIHKTRLLLLTSII